MKAVIYDSQFLSGAGIEAVLRNSSGDYEVVLLDTHKKLEAQLEKHRPDLLILEYVGPNPVPVETLSRVKNGLPKLKILIISEDDDSIEIKRRISLGVDGFLTKDCSEEEISNTISAIRSGGNFYCKKVVDMMSDQDDVIISELSERESQVLHLISKGMSSNEIADKLHLSIHTINSHRKKILKKLGFKSPTELIAYAVKKFRD